ncbi:helix-turn-helix domain-containing protein [Streptomyces changanensis]|uniref:Helix-turn-helix domain-containing protein n=1 Tax=Streptomyces changanensis TaxID=2964669 RepID=A0ABY5NAK4_9ACTN|nr:helix-turn-helix transcriptional regulator [Streptomyces changanensis]UUS33054.1 helix-turn-helix domain-containing protein [Streptomyces changanensis]
MSRRNATGGAASTTAALFGEVLKHHREAAGLTQDALARDIPCDRSHIARVESGTRVPQDTFASRCDELLGTGGMLLRLWGKVDWYPNVEHPDWFERRVRMEAEAVVVREYQALVIPGLLQTAAYVRSLFSLHCPDAEEVEERVRARLSRQPRYLSPQGPLYIVVLDESCLRTVMGSPAVMRDQCAHLLDVAERPNIRLQVAPFADPRIDRPNTSLSLIRLPDGEELLYSESLLRGHFSTDPSDLARYNRTYDVMRADVLSARESAALIRNVMEGYEGHGQAKPPRGALDQEQLQRKQQRQLHRNRPRFPRRRPRA